MTPGPVTSKMKFISISFFQHSGHDDRQLPDTSKEDVWFSIFQLTCLLKQMARKYTTFYNDLLWKEYMWRPNGTNFFHLKSIYDLEETGLSLLYIKIYIYLICLMYLLSKVLSFWKAYFGNNLLQDFISRTVSPSIKIYCKFYNWQFRQ